MKKIDLNYNKTLKLTNALVAEIGENDFNNLNLVLLQIMCKVQNTV